MKKKRLGEVLRERGTVSATDLTHALQEQQGKLVHLGELLLQGGSVSKKDLIAALGEVTSVPYFDCSKVQVPADVLETIPAGMAWRFNVLPVRLADKSLTVVLDEPQNVQIIDELRFKTGKIIVPQLGFQGEIRTAIERHYGPNKSLAPAVVRSAGLVKDVKEMEFISSTDQQRNIDAMREMQAELMQKSKTTPAVMLVASMIKAAAQRRASDMHEYALERVKEGLTTLDEVLRVVPIEYAPVICESCQRELAGSYAYCPHCGERAHARGTETSRELQGVEQGVLS